jgi:hypothetical protein
MYMSQARQMIDDIRPDLLNQYVSRLRNQQILPVDPHSRLFFQMLDRMIRMQNPYYVCSTVGQQIVHQVASHKASYPGN